MRRIAVINQKGGVGKTTTTVNLGAALARLGQRVLVCDLDPQCNLTVHLDVDPSDGRPSVYELLHGKATLADVVPDSSSGDYVQRSLAVVRPGATDQPKSLEDLLRGLDLDSSE
jgi:cellulose biosynthesis protein BcsQ